MAVRQSSDDEVLSYLTERPSCLPYGRLFYWLKRRWRDSTSQVILEPIKPVERLAALVPPPRFNLMGQYGVPAPSAGWGQLVIPPEQGEVCRSACHARALLDRIHEVERA